MSTRTFHCALTATITVEDETVKSAMLGSGLRDGLSGEPVTDEDTVFTAQQQMLGLVGSMPPDQLLQMLLVNGYFVPLAGPVKQLLEERLPGAEVTLTGIEVRPAAG